MRVKRYCSNESSSFRTLLKKQRTTREKKRKSRFAFYFKKKNESSSNNVDTFNDVQAAVNNFNANKKDQKSNNDYFCMNKTNIKCYNCHEKRHIVRHCAQFKSENSKKDKNRST